MKRPKIDIRKWASDAKPPDVASRLRQQRFGKRSGNWPTLAEALDDNFLEAAEPFSWLSPKIPVALLPVRIETRFVGNTLKVRVFPDQIGVAGFDRRVTKSEKKAAERYLEKANDAPDIQAELALWDRLVAVHDARRMAWAIRHLRSGKALEIMDETPWRSHAPLLPDRWLVTGYVGNQRVLNVRAPEPIAKDIFLSPDPASLAADETTISFDDAFAWLTDFRVALEKGMALDCPLDDRTMNGFDELIVLGVRDPGGAAQEQAAAFDALIEDHTFEWGAAFVPQGTATNVGQEGGVWSLRDADTEGLFHRIASSKAHETFERTPVSESADAALTPLEGSGPPENMAFQHLQTALGLSERSSLGRIGNRDVTEDALARAMNTALWPVTLGEVTDQLLRAHDNSEYLTDLTQRGLKKHFCTHLRGTTALPAFRVGNTPYGVLPIAAMPPLSWTQSDPANASLRVRVERFARKLMPHWSHAAQDVLTMATPPATLAGLEAPGARLLDLLRLGPHPQDFLQSSVDDIRSSVDFQYELGKLILTDWQHSNILKKAFTIADSGGETYLLYAFSPLVDWGPPFADAQDQEATIRGLRDAIASVLADEDERLSPFADSLGSVIADELKSQNSDAIRAVLEWYDFVLELLAEHADRCHMLEVIGASDDFYNAMVGEQSNDPPLAYLWDRDDRQGWPAASFVEVEKGAQTVSYKSWMAALQTRATALDMGTTVPSYPSFPDDDAPLLYQLLRESLVRTQPDDMGDFAKALLDLTALNAAQAEHLAQATLGLASWRLDAWLTGLTKWRLDELRSETPRGLQIGAYGWVEDLRPRKDEKPSNGFVLTPSLNHARTAAVLRSGYDVYRDLSGGEVFAVDLSSDRMRDAKWAFDAVRQGQDLGDVLGARFERALLDGLLAPEWIYPIRAAVKELTESDDPGALESVDGLDLLRVWQQDSAGLQSAAELQMQAVSPPGYPALDSDGLQSAIEVLVSYADALADAGLADAVHSLVQGNPVAAGATLSAISTGDAGPPAMDLLKTAPPGRVLTHRVLLAVEEPRVGEDKATAPWRAAVEPGMEALAASLVGAPKAWRFRYEVVLKGAVAQSGSVSWSDIRSAGAPEGFGALDLMTMLPDYALTAQSRLWRWVARFVAARLPKALEAADVRPVADAALDALLDRARAWAAVVLPARPAELRDFNDGRADVAAPEPAALTMLADSVTLAQNAFETAAKTTQRFSNRFEGADPSGISLSRDQTRRLKDALETLPYFGFHEAVIPVRRPSTAHIILAVRSVASQVADRMARLSAIDRSEDIKSLRARLKVLFGRTAFGALPLEPKTTAAGDCFRASSTRLGGSTAPAFEWLEKWSYVRPSLRNLTDAILINETDPDVAVGQWPEEQLTPWAALALPQDRDTAATMLALVHGDAEKVMQSSLVGVIIDEITDRIPASDVDAGVAFHFDAPGSEAPQTILLALPPEGEDWSHDTMLDAVRMALELARIRSVDGGQMPDFNQIIPAILAGQGTNVPVGEP